MLLAFALPSRNLISLCTLQYFSWSTNRIPCSNKTPKGKTSTKTCAIKDVAWHEIFSLTTKVELCYAKLLEIATCYVLQFLENMNITPWYNLLGSYFAVGNAPDCIELSEHTDGVRTSLLLNSHSQFKCSLTILIYFFCGWRIWYLFIKILQY